MAKLKWLVNTGNYYYFKDAPVHATGVSLDKSSITFTEIGQTEQLTATVTPDDAVNKKVIWTSSDTSVATVSKTGLVTCVSNGSATITATTDDKGISTTCSVSVVKQVDFLLVGGGGGGGGHNGDSYSGGGGGGGGFIECCNYLLCSGNYSITIGNGGSGAVGFADGCNGGNSEFNSVTAYGGGGGGKGSGYVGHSGGSGGGGGGLCSGGNGCLGQGNCGGTGYYYSGGGGGGASESGSSTSNCLGGDGGMGKTSCISGSCQRYSGGGGGGSMKALQHAYGNKSGTTWIGNATIYGGGGGGGQYCCTSNGYNGCQGVFILRYPTACGYNITGGCKYTCGDYTIHCFTSSGTLTIS